MTEMNNHIGGRGSMFVLRSLWRTWALSYGAITLPMVFALFTPKLYMPFVTLLLSYLMYALLRYRRDSIETGCSLLIRIASVVLLWSGLIMLTINILFTPFLVGRVIELQFYNDEIPFLTCLIVFPTAIFFCSVYLLSGRNTRQCMRCREQNGDYSGDSIAGMLYYRESRYQISLLLLVMFILTVLETWYYFFSYINANLNSPDRFVFIYMPMVVYLVSLVMMAGRYMSMLPLIHSLRTTRPGEHKPMSIVRYLVFSGDEMLVHNDADGYMDTPYELLVGQRTDIGQESARFGFSELTGLEGFSLKYLFSSKNYFSGDNVFHYAVFPTDEMKAAIGSENDSWINLYEIDLAIKEGRLKPMLYNEIYRIHTVTMAWKTYDRNGRRLYPIKHYRPTFRLRDLPEWNVDYDDLSWFSVSINNEDRSFFHLRRLWEKASGIFRPKSKARG